MLHCTASCLTYTKYCATGGFYYVFRNGIKGWLPIQVGTLYLVTVVFWGRTECDCKVLACVQSFALQGERRC